MLIEHSDRAQLRKLPMRHSSRPNSAIRYLALLVLLSAFAGCGDSRVKNMVAAANQNNVEKLRSCYLLYVARNQYKGPKSEQELKDFLATNDTIDKNLKLIEISRSDVDDLFVSLRDDLPLLVCWGQKLMPGSKSAVVSEAVGVDGKRRVAFSNGTSREVDEAEFEKEFAGKF